MFNIIFCFTCNGFTEKLTLQPKECMIVEDAPKGIEAAKQTGANVYEVSGYNEVTLENILTKINYFRLL